MCELQLSDLTVHNIVTCTGKRENRFEAGSYSSSEGVRDQVCESAGPKVCKL